MNTLRVGTVWKKIIMTSAWNITDDVISYDPTTLNTTNGLAPIGLDTPGNNTTCHTLRMPYDEVFRVYALTVEVYLTGCLCVVGFIGNFLSFVVLQKDKQTTTTFLLQALAVLDTLYLFTCLWLQVYEGVYYFSGWFIRDSGFYPYMEVYMYPFARMTQMATEWVIVLVTVERYVAVCRPGDARRVCCLSRMKVALFVVITTSVLYNVPTFFEVTTERWYDKCTKVWRVLKQHTTLYYNPIYHLLHRCIMRMLLRWLVPLTILILLNYRLIMRLRIAWKRRAQIKKATGKSRRLCDGNNITLMLVIVVIVFILCQTPHLTLIVVETLQAYVPSFRVYYRSNTRNWLFYLFLCNFLLTVNSSVNFLIYCLLGKRFRKILGKLFCAFYNNQKGSRASVTLTG